MTNLYEVVHHFDRVMRRIDASMHSKVATIDKDKIGPLGSMILTRLAYIEPAPVQKLVDQMGRDNSQMTRAIKALAAKGLVEREVSAHDRRVSVLSLSPKGRAFATQIREIMSEVVEELVAPLSRSEQQSLIKLLLKL